MESIDREVAASNFQGDFNQPGFLVRRTYLNLLTRLNLKQFTFKSAKSALLGALTLFLLNANAGEAIAQIRRGEQGPQVREIQRCLKRLGIYGGPVNGRFGPLTENAVTKFQRRVKLRQVGFVGPRTDAALKKRCKSRPSRNTSRRPNCTRLREGCDGPRVRTLQRNLRSLRVYSGPVSGRFRGLTKSAVIRYQQRKGIDPIGVVGPRTRRAIRRDLNSFQPQPRRTPQPPRSRGRFCDPNVQPLSIGCNGQWVTKLQQDLQLIGYFQDRIDGSYGRLTQDAVERFQQRYNLPVTGTADFQTLSTITAVINFIQNNRTIPPDRNPSTIRPIPGPSPIPGDTTILPPTIPGSPPNSQVFVPGPLRLGSRGMQVTRLQQDLRQLGYFPIQPTGIFDTYTQNVLLRFQQDNRLNLTGEADINTLQLIRQILTNNRGRGGGEAFDSLYEGMSGNRVKQLQLRLKELGFFRDSEATGYYGAITRTAVSNFQQLYNLQITGSGVKHFECMCQKFLSVG